MNEWIAQYIRKINQIQPNRINANFRTSRDFVPSFSARWRWRFAREKLRKNRRLGKKRGKAESCRAKPWCDFADRDLQKILSVVIDVCCTRGPYPRWSER